MSTSCVLFQRFIMYAIIILYVLHVCDAVNYLQPVEVNELIDMVDPVNRVNSTVHRTVKKYYCGDRDVEDSYLLIYGSKGWTFPVQNVNITLSYPTGHVRHFNAEPWEDFIIVGFRVNLYLDGSDTTGYISEGGIYQDFISLTFLCSNISTLSYQFWLYGIPKTLYHSNPFPATNNLSILC